MWSGLGPGWVAADAGPSGPLARGRPDLGGQRTVTTQRAGAAERLDRLPVSRWLTRVMAALFLGCLVEAYDIGLTGSVLPSLTSGHRGRVDPGQAGRGVPGRAAGGRLPVIITFGLVAAGAALAFGSPGTGRDLGGRPRSGRPAA